MSKQTVKVKSLTWTCEVCPNVTLSSLHPKQLENNRREHERSKRHQNRLARVMAKREEIA